MADRLEASMILCTLDRGPDIELTIESLLGQEPQAHGAELLIVDNGSSAENAELLRRYQRLHPDRIRYVLEPKTGLSHARNRGIEESRGEILLFIDDDAIASPGWLSAYLETFAKDQGLGVIGGRVGLRFSKQRPDWMKDWMLPYLGAFDFGSLACGLTYMAGPRGGNMAFRRRVFEEAGPFSDRFGREGRCLASLEEVEMCYRAASSGWRLGYIPDAAVLHIVRPDRFDPSWFSARLYWQGRSLARFELLHLGRWQVLKKLPGQLARWVKRRGLSKRLAHGYLSGAARGFVSPR